MKTKVLRGQGIGSLNKIVIKIVHYIWLVKDIYTLSEHLIDDLIIEA